MIHHCKSMVWTGNVINWPPCVIELEKKIVLRSIYAMAHLSNALTWFNNEREGCNKEIT